MLEKFGHGSGVQEARDLLFAFAYGESKGMAGSLTQSRGRYNPLP